MKKLLSILAVSGIIATSAPTAVACESSTKPPTNKQDLITDNINIYIGYNIYDDIRKNLAAQAGENITEQQIKDDNQIQIYFFDGDISGTPLDDPTIAVSGSLYNLNIIITSDDQYFNQNNFVEEYSPISDKVDVSLDDIVLYVGNNIYDDVKISLAKQAVKDITADDINNDTGIVFTMNITSKAVLPLPNPTVATSGSSYLLKITIESTDIYFNSTNGQDTKEIPVTEVS